MTKRTCTVEGCERPHNARGWCGPHYTRWHKYGDPTASAPRADPVCSVDGCERNTVAKRMCALHYYRVRRSGTTDVVRVRKRCAVDGCDELVAGRGWCSKHYTRWSRHGSPTARVKGEVIAERRICPGCLEDKSVEDFSASTGRCRTCIAALAKVRRLGRIPVSHPVIHCIICATEFTPRTSKTYCCSDICTAERKRQLDSYYQRVDGHPDAKKRWSDAHPEERVQTAARRRARKLNTQSRVLSRADVAARMLYFGNRCWMCNGPFEAIDHVKPLSKGGPHILANLRPACTPCNSRKSNKWNGLSTVKELAA